MFILANEVIKEITNYDELKESLEIIIKTYKDRDEKMNLSNENNYRHSNMTYEDKNIQPLLYTDYSYPASNKAYINAGYDDKGILINFSCSRDKNETI